MQFKTLPGVGKSIAEDLFEMGYRGLNELSQQDPDDLYQQHCRIKGQQVDRCFLYVMRCINYSLNTIHPDKEKLKWWNWNDEKIKKERDK